MQSDQTIARRADPGLAAFNHINPTTLCQDKVLVPGSRPDVDGSLVDGGGIRYNPAPSDVIMKRYQVAGFIDEGGFGAVYKAVDLYTGTVVAVKVFHKGLPAHRDRGTEESIYMKLVAGCSANIGLFAEMMDSGEHDGHHFLVLELCGPTLLQLLNTKKLLPLPRRHVQEIGFQLIQGVAYMHSLGLIHTDLKPDNIALKHSGMVSVRCFDPNRGFRTSCQLVSAQICILDLGGALEESDDGTEYSAGAINYRAPEISLGMPFDHTADIFSTGCIMAEVHLNSHLFPHDIDSGREHVALVERICGPFSANFAADAQQFEPGVFRIKDGVASVRFPGKDFDASVHAEPLRRLQNARPLSTRVDDSSLGNLLRRLLDPNPYKRMELSQAMRHTYFDGLQCCRL